MTYKITYVDTVGSLMTVSSRDPRAGPSLSRDLSGRSLTLGVRSPVTLFVVLVIRLRG